MTTDASPAATVEVLTEETLVARIRDRHTALVTLTGTDDLDEIIADGLGYQLGRRAAAAFGELQNLGYLAGIDSLPCCVDDDEACVEAWKTGLTRIVTTGACERRSHHRRPDHLTHAENLMLGDDITPPPAAHRLGDPAVHRPGLVGWWTLEVIGGLVGSAGALMYVLALHSSGVAGIGVTVVLATIALVLLWHGVSTGIEQYRMRRMSDEELHEVLERAHAIARRDHDVYQPRHSR